MARTELGSACWDEWQGFENKEALHGCDVVIGHPLPDLYKNECDENRMLCFSPSRHFLSVASTRSGKGVSLIIPNLLQYEGSAIIIDPKGENAWITAHYRRVKLKQKVFILDPWGEVNRRYGELAGIQEQVAQFNPLSILDPQSPHYADDLAYLADALIINQGKDPHWDDSARELVGGLIAYAVERYGKNASLPMVRMLLSKPAEQLAGIATDAQRLGFESVAARKLGRFMNDSREIGSIISTALTQTAFLDSATLGESLSDSNFSFEDLVNEKATIYLVLPVDKLQTYGRWLRLMVSIGIRTVARNVKPLEQPVLFILDEFGTIGRLSAVAQAYGLMSGLQMCIWAFVQDLVQLKRDYPDDWETFVGNSEAVTAFNIMDQFTCDYFSKILGSSTVERISQLTADMRKRDKNYAGRMTDQIFSRQLLFPEEIRNFPSRMGIITGRFTPVQFYKLRYYEDPIFLLRSRPDPHFPSMITRRNALIEEMKNPKPKPAPIPKNKYFWPIDLLLKTPYIRHIVALLIDIFNRLKSIQSGLKS